MVDALPAAVTNEIFERGSWAELPGMIHARYDGLLDRVSYYRPLIPSEADAGWPRSGGALASLRD